MDASSEGVQILLDGNDQAMQKNYKQLNTGVQLNQGDRVVVMKMSGSYVVMGKISYDSSGSGGDYVKKTGDTMSGNLWIERSQSYLMLKSTDCDLDNPSATAGDLGGVEFYDKNNKGAGFFRATLPASGKNNILFGLAKTPSGSSSAIGHYLQMAIAPDGTRSVTVSDAAAWLSALGFTSGTNYIKLGDGTMIVYGIASCTASGASTVYFPASFSASYADYIVGVATPRYWRNSETSVAYGTATRCFIQAMTNRCSVYFRNATTGATITDTNEQAYFAVIGRWK